MRLSYLVRQLWLGLTARSSMDYWERRYRAGLTSGSGSYGDLAAFKAEFLNEFVHAHSIQSVVEFGCGDGGQLALASYPRYLGLDVSPTAIDLCSSRFRDDRTKSFLLYDSERTINLGNFVNGDLTLSLDVIYHLLEEQVYRRYLSNLFVSSRRFVIVYSSNRESRTVARHVRERQFTADVQREIPEFRLIRTVPNRYPEMSISQFFVFERICG